MDASAEADPIARHSPPQRGFCLAVFIPGKRVHAITKNVGCLTLIQIEFFTHPGDLARVNVSGVHLPLERSKQLAVAVTVFSV